MIDNVEGWEQLDPHDAVKRLPTSGAWTRARNSAGAMDYVLQPVQPSQFAVVAGWLDSPEATLRWAGPGIPFPLPAEAFAAALALPSRPGWTLQDADGACLGFGQYWQTTPDSMHIGRIIVSPQARGRGLGRELMTALCAEALRSSAAVQLTLKVYRDNQAAVALYRDLGFVASEDASTPELLFMACRTT
ncbi:GNAT family N-acetyltransferase [Stenotrophomonas indicatrix]|jgi:ribosomal protein S18 acetylase RimI-like enzyme|uniref:GNAT family N-acetyltransferase n=1 Tax=Stenotrophomonas indicatrix TaxID=2045451 RepID=UPI000AD3F329|nr:N-acetyltransferase [Stenotrophomonas indicatrix]